MAPGAFERESIFANNRVEEQIRHAHENKEPEKQRTLLNEEFFEAGYVDTPPLPDQLNHC